MLRNIFNSEDINIKRQPEIDLARGLAVLFMILVHVNGQFLIEIENTSLFARVIDFLGTIPAAPIFMFAMGIGFVYSRNQAPGQLFKRGVLIFIGGYVLNFFRGFLPLLIGTQLGYYTINLDNLPWYYYLVEVDILQFAGLAMIFIALLRRLKVKEVYYPLLAIIIGAISPFLWSMRTGHVFPDILIACLFGGNNYAYHTFFSWIFYPLMGSFFGWLLKKVNNKQKFYILAVVIALPVAIIGFAIASVIPNYDFGIITGNIYNYFHHGLASNLVFISFIFCWLALCFLAARFLPKFIMNKLQFWSKAVLVMYVVHWIIIGWAEFLVFDNFEMAYAILAMVVLTFLTDRISDLYFKVRERWSDRKEHDKNDVVTTGLN